MPALIRPVRSHAMSADPEPMKGSRTRAPGSLLLLMARSMRGRGFIVGWSGDSDGRSMCQTSSWSRPPFQTRFAPSRQPYQMGSQMHRWSARPETKRSFTLMMVSLHWPFFDKDARDQW